MNTVHYSEDVREAITYAERLAKKEHHQPISDKHYLQGLLMAHRKFNRLDRILASLRVSAAHLRGQLLKTKRFIEPPSPDNSLLAQAERIAHTGAGNKHPMVEVEHLLKACVISSDPGIHRLFQENNITWDRIDMATQHARKNQFLNNILFLLREFAEVIVFVLVFLILIKTFLGELRLIPSESMVPGLQVEDRLVIERLTHWVRPYQRGDVLVFYPPMTELPKDPWSVFLRLTGFSGLIYKKEDNVDVAYIKRLIGLPGDTVDVRPNDGVFINGKKLDEPYVNEIADSCTQMRPTILCKPIKVPVGKYYMMGDNRNMSLDSRYWGFAEEARVIGRAVFRVWPLPRVGTLTPAPYQAKR